MSMCPTQPAPAQLSWRTLREAGLDGEPSTLFKADHRSRVWSVDVDGHVVVIKRFEHTPARQRLAYLLGCHPAQRELIRQRQLSRAGIPVVLAVDAGAEPVGAFGCRVWLATRHAGVTLQTAMVGEASDRLAALLDDTARLTRLLLDGGWTFKDLKPSNILITPEGQLMLIDVGSARRSTSPRRIAQMLAVMHRVLTREGVPSELRERYERNVTRWRGR